MRRYVLLLVFLFSALFIALWWKNPTSKFTFQPGHFIVANCKIFDSTGAMIKQFPYSICLPLDDGGLIAKMWEDDEKGIARFDHLGNRTWILPIQLHHLINFDQEKKYILAIGSEDSILNGKSVRFDIYYKIDLDGKIRSKFRTKDHLEDLLKIKKEFTDASWADVFSKAQYELTHSNSICEIPANDYEGKNPEFRRGNILVNTHERLIILDPDMNSILWISKMKWPLHGVNFLQKGILALNTTWSPGPNSPSSIVLIDPFEESILMKIEGKKSDSFYSSSYGGVMPLEQEKFLIWYNATNDEELNKQKGKLVLAILDRSGAFLWRHNIEAKKKSKKFIKPPPLAFSQYLDLTKFLKNSGF